MSPERRNELPRAPKTSLGAPLTRPRPPKTLPTAPNDLPDAPPSAPEGAQPSLPGPPGSSPALEKPMFSLRKTMNSHLSTPPRAPPAQEPDLRLKRYTYYPQPPGPKLVFFPVLLLVFLLFLLLTPTPRAPASRGRRTYWAAPTAADPEKRSAADNDRERPAQVQHINTQTNFEIQTFHVRDTTNFF